VDKELIDYLERMEQRIVEGVRNTVVQDIEQRVVPDLEQRIVQSVGQDLEQRVLPEMEHRIVQSVGQDLEQRVLPEMEHRIVQSVGQDLEQRVLPDMEQRIVQGVQHTVMQDLDDRIERILDTKLEPIRADLGEIKHRVNSTEQHVTQLVGKLVPNLMQQVTRISEDVETVKSDLSSSSKRLELHRNKIARIEETLQLRDLEKN
jgi:hypothetical protein